MHTSETPEKSYGKSLKMMPQEEMLETGRKNGKLFIGIPKEISFQENRVALVPESINLLVNNGHQVVVESNAGKAANFSDNEYSEAGATIVYTAKDVYAADIILKIAPPSLQEAKMMKNKQTIISALHPTIQDKELFNCLIEKKITAFAFEFIKEERSNTYPVVRSMSEIAGNTAVLVAAEYLSNVNKGKGLMLGGIAGVTPTNIVILGAGTVGEFAARSAMGLGAVVHVFDNSLEKLRRLQNNLGTRVFTSIVQPKVLLKALMRADVVIGAFHNAGERTPCYVSEEMVREMKPGSVIVDISIDKGGSFATSKVTNHANPTYKVNEVVHYCVPNINSRVSRTASYALSNIFTPILISVADEGGVLEKIKRDTGLRNGAYLFNGMLTSKFVGEMYGLSYKDINLIITAF